MGLDMYLSGKKFLAGGYEHSSAAEKKSYNSLLKIAGLDKADMPQTTSANIEITLAYWRKANAIHKWFVDKVQGGVDECQDTSVSREQLQELSDLCKQVLANHELAELMLPATSGFFFGSTDYDEWYYKDLELTVSQLDKILSNPKFEGWDFQYRSSW